MICLCGVIFQSIAAAGQRSVVAETRLPAKFASAPGEKPPAWRYWLHLPAASEEQSSDDRWPLILYLHGRSCRGHDLDIVKRYGPPAFLDKKPEFPFIVISPQLPNHSWPPDSLLALLDEAEKRYAIDPERIYLTGVSMGGGGSWHLAAEAPNRFAAMIPLCGYWGTSIAPKLTKLPIWAFHGEVDEITPLGPHQKLVEAVQLAGGMAKLTVIPDGTHGNIIFPTYGRDDIYDWLLSHRRGKPSSLALTKQRPSAETKPAPEASPKKMKPSVTIRYVVVKGENLWRIGKKHGVSVDELMHANSLKSDLLRIGQVLMIPSAE